MLDTNVVSAALRGHPEIDARLNALSPGQWCISAITRSELRYGLALKPGATKLALLVEGFLQATTTLAWDEAAADSHGRVRAQLRLAGTSIGDFDEMIAAHALSAGAVLVTDNFRHFGRVAGLTLENWVRAN